MTQNKKIAVTGGLGSGKSAFCAILRDMGYPVLSCDDINRELLEEKEYRAALARAFPQCLTDGDIDKKKLAGVVFSDEQARETLNALAHPAIMVRLRARMDEQTGAVFCEVPLLFEGGYESAFDAVIALRRKREARIAAVAERDGMARGEALRRMEKQFDPALLEQKKCIIIENDGDLASLRKKAVDALQTLRLRS